MRYLIFFFLKKSIVRTAKKVLRKQYSKEAIRDILVAYKKRVYLLEKTAPKEKKMGGKIVVELGVLSVAFFQVLIEIGESKEKSTEILFSITWSVYQKIGKFSWKISGIGAKTSFSHLKKVTSSFRKFPFGNPSYLWESIDSDDEIVAFNCLKCPVAEYFMSHDLSDVCVDTWCNLDYPLADEIWHSELIRTDSIAGGAKICDFKWKVKV